MVTRGHDGGRAGSGQASSGQDLGREGLLQWQGLGTEAAPSARSLAALWQGGGWLWVGPHAGGQENIFRFLPSRSSANLTS